MHRYMTQRALNEYIVEGIKANIPSLSKSNTLISPLWCSKWLLIFLLVEQKNKCSHWPSFRSGTAQKIYFGEC